MSNAKELAELVIEELMESVKNFDKTPEIVLIRLEHAHKAIENLAKQINN